MAKGKKKGVAKTGRGGTTGGVFLGKAGSSQYGSSDDESVETCSVFSGDSHYHPSASPATRGSQDNTDEDGSQSGPDEIDSFEDRLREAVDGAATSKSGQRRVSCLQGLVKAFGDRYCPEFLSSRPTTMADLVERALRRGTGDEQAAAATLAAILVLQYGASPNGGQVYQALAKILGTTLADTSLAAGVREKAAMALSVTAMMAEDDPFRTQEILEQLRSVFAGSFLKGDGTAPNVSPALSGVHQTCLLCWALMLTVSSPDIAFQNITRHVSSVSGMLQSADVEMRVAAGEALATMFEVARERDEDFDGDGNLDELCECLHQLATDSARFRAKKDRRMQKSSFRDIERAVRDGEGPELNVQFGVETLRIRSWEDKRTYDALCSLLGSGMNHHLTNNPEVRALFGLGAPLVTTNGSGTKTTKFERHMGNVLADRNRTKRMAKVRDKRLDIM